MCTEHVAYLARTWRSWLCRMAVRVKSGRTASRLVSRPQWAVRRLGVTMTTGSMAEGSPCWESWEVTESLVSVSLWPMRHIKGHLIEKSPQQYAHCVSHSLCLWLEILWPHNLKHQTEVNNVLLFKLYTKDGNINTQMWGAVLVYNYHWPQWGSLLKENVRVYMVWRTKPCSITMHVCTHTYTHSLSP